MEKIVNNNQGQIQAAQQKKEELLQQARERANKTGNEVRIIDGQLVEIKSDQNIQREATNNVNRDLQGGEDFAREIVGRGLSRLGDDADNKLVTNKLRENLEGDSQASNLRRSQGVQGIAGQEQSAQRSLASSLSRSGVSGGAAAAAQLEIAAQGINARRQFQENFLINEADREREAISDFANFTTSTAKFDIEQEQAEKALELQARLGFTNLLSTERNSIRQQEAANLLAAQEKDGGKK